MKSWASVYPWLLLLVLAAAATALGFAVFFPKPLERPVGAFVFSSDPLPNWHADESYASSTYDEHGAPLKARYLSRQDHVPITASLRFTPDIRALFEGGTTYSATILPSGYLPLDIDMRVLLDGDGKLRINARDASIIPGTAELRRDAKAGSFAFWRDTERVHLSGVIVPNHRSVVTRREFSGNLYGRQWSLQGLERWWHGKGRMPDPSCVIVDIAVLESAASPDAIRRQLELAWAQWRPWCGGHFPEAR